MHVLVAASASERTGAGVDCVQHLVQLLCLSGSGVIETGKFQGKEALSCVTLPNYLCFAVIPNVLSVFKTVEAEYPDNASPPSNKPYISYSCLLASILLGDKRNLLLGRVLLLQHQRTRACSFFSVHLRKVSFYDSCGLLKTLLVPRILSHLMEA